MDYFDISNSKKKTHKKLNNTKKIFSKSLSGPRSKARGYYFPKKKFRARTRYRSKKNHMFKSHKKKIYVGGIF